MKTDDLIRTLSIDNDWRTAPVGRTLTLALALAAPISLVLFFAIFGIRPDAANAMHNPFFDLKFAITIALAFSAIAISVHLSRPQSSLAGWAWLLAIPVALLGAGIAADLIMPQRLGWTTRLVGSNSKVCMTAIPLLSMPLLIAALFALRSGAPARPAVAGAFAGLLSAGIAATLYAAHCTDDSPLFVATWYPMAMAIVVAIGAVAGARLLRI